MQLPVRADERADVGLEPGLALLLEHAHVPRSGVDAELVREHESTVAELDRRFGWRHALAIGTRSRPPETFHPDGVIGRLRGVRPPTVIDPGRLIAGRHPCALSPDEAVHDVRRLADDGVTLFVDLTQEGELEPYAAHVEPPARYVSRPILDFSVPTREQLVAALDEIDAELEAGGVVYVHCWAGCGRTGVVVGSWLVRHGADPGDALQRIADARGLGCPQTLEQRSFVLDWKPGL